MSDKFEVADHSFYGIRGSERPENAEVEVRQEFDGKGNHRIAIGSKVSDTAGYHGFSVLEGKQGKFFGCSDYYSGVFPRVFQVLPGV